MIGLVGADLPVIRNRILENYFLFEKKFGQFWLGAMYERAEDKWMWVDGQEVKNYTHWATRSGFKPNDDYECGEHCAYQNTYGWTDTQCGRFDHRVTCICRKSFG